METESPQTRLETPAALVIDWTESEWFQDWLASARRDHKGDGNARDVFPAFELAA